MNHKYWNANELTYLLYRSHILYSYLSWIAIAIMMFGVGIIGTNLEFVNDEFVVIDGTLMWISVFLFFGGFFWFGGITLTNYYTYGVLSHTKSYSMKKVIWHNILFNGVIIGLKMRKYQDQEVEKIAFNSDESMNLLLEQNGYRKSLSWSKFFGNISSSLGLFLVLLAPVLFSDDNVGVGVAFLVLGLLIIVASRYLVLSIKELKEYQVGHEIVIASFSFLFGGFIPSIYQIKWISKKDEIGSESSS